MTSVMADHFLCCSIKAQHGIVCEEGSEDEYINLSHTTEAFVDILLHRKIVIIDGKIGISAVVMMTGH